MQIRPTQRFVSAITRDTLALVLAGGRGSRLGALTQWRAKPAVPFGGKFRIIDFALSNCINSGIRRVGVPTQYMAHSLVTHLTQAWGFLRRELGEFVDILPAQQRTGPTWYKGTADAVYQNQDLIRNAEPHFVLVLGGDHIYKMDYGVLLGFHVAHGADVTVACIEVPREEATEFGVMHTDESGLVVGFLEKPADPPPTLEDPNLSLVSMGIYVFTTEYLMACLAKDAALEGSSHDFGKDILPQAVGRDRIFAFPFRDQRTGKRAYWRDVGNPDAFYSSNLELVAVTPELDIYDEEWPIWTYQEQAPPAKFVFNEPTRRGLAVDSMVSGGCIVSGAVVRHSLLFSYVRVAEGSVLEDVVLLPRVMVGQNCRIRRAVIDSGCVIPDGTVIGEDPVADAARFEMSPKGICVVTSEMLGQGMPLVL